MKKNVIVGLVAVGVLSVNAFAALTVDTSSAVADITAVFGSILAVAVLIFGYRKVKSLLS